MSIPKNKVKLSPRLQLGVGRTSGSNNLLKYISYLFLMIGFVFIVRAGALVWNQSSSVDELRPQVLGAHDTPSEQMLFEKYTVKKGDTVFSIGQQYNIEWTTLATLNNLQPPFELKPNQVLNIPKQ